MKLNVNLVSKPIRVGRDAFEIILQVDDLEKSKIATQVFVGPGGVPHHDHYTRGVQDAVHHINRALAALAQPTP